MPYKAVAQRVPRTTETFLIGNTREILQKNGVKTTITEAKRDDGFSKRDITIFANGARVDKVKPHLKPGSTATLIGKYSQGTVFVAFDAVSNH
jgi:hypothetical protein